MQSHLITAVAVAGLAQQVSSSSSSSNSSSQIVTDLNVIQRYWGQLSPYADNAASYFGVQDVGLPDGCAIEQAHTLQRHAQRFATSAFDDGVNDENFAQKVANWTGPAKFTGPLSFLNTYEYLLNDEGYLTNIGANTEFVSGATFWNRYGRLLYDAVPGQLQYNASFPNGTARPKPVLRTTSQSRITNSQINWALGFFGTSFQVTPDPTLANFTAPFDVVTITEGGTENNTLAAYDSCFNDYDYPVVEMGDLDLETYIPKYLAAATARLSQYVPSGFDWTANDTYAMQSICAYENAYIGDSQFCGFFALDEWAGFELTLDTEYYYDYSWGNPTGRAQGIGYLQELLARLQKQYIDVSSTSVNSTLTDNPTTFPLDQAFYADFSHDDIIISVLTAMSMDYFKDAPDFTQYPPDPERKFILSNLTPFGARLVTEVIGCTSPSPAVNPYYSTVYSRTANGYNAGNATYKFIRQRLNNGILPLDSIRGGACEGRTDGLCPMTDFIDSQTNSTNLANYQYACFGNYSISYDEVLAGKDYDGTIFEDA
ncbi:phosphoglycerate mutase-like protein [Cryphonectria parasitica EP155]|uniref:Phosphoglycerate mutase-like protein n=1 Tax=Cryphonectria parasitica (strain ATCC 38755 / EP155) TaxID=660469 RepID=A0A9P4Y3U4_CRYP1|nr:phosphoglycerate mutase-like protein [Cryphonectria parasitica EP155]KAF3766028.1 phosphoglycerate mutase-like protein [Cryphonectria parasitica EP155]